MGTGFAIVLTLASLAGAPAGVSVSAIQKANAAATAENALITQAQTAMNAKDWQAAEAPLQQLVAMNPARWDYQEFLGNVEFNLGKYEEAVKAFEAGVSGAQQAPDGAARNRKAIGFMLTSEGNAYLKLRRNSDAVAEYSKAAQIDPNPAVAWFNLCATEYNLGDMDNAVKSCDQAIKVDPARADAYFIKGSALYGNGTLDANNKYVVPAGTVEALRMYLKLAPKGGHVADVQAMLDALK